MGAWRRAPCALRSTCFRSSGRTSGPWPSRRQVWRSAWRPASPSPRAAAPGRMADSPIVELDTQDGVAWLRLNRPDALNALNRRLTAPLAEALERVAGLDEPAPVGVGGRGGFWAGTDTKEREAGAPAEAEAPARRHAAIMARFASLPQVTIAAVDGFALGGGLMLAIAQDLRIASDRARFGLPEVTL